MRTPPETPVVDSPVPADYTTVVDAADVGADTTGERPFDVARFLDDDTLVRFSPGRYLLEPVRKDSLSNVALYAPDGATLVSNGSGLHDVLHLRDASDVHVEGFDLEQSPEAPARTKLVVDGGTNSLRDYRVVGAYDPNDESGDHTRNQALLLECAGESTELLVERVDLSDGGMASAVFVDPTLEASDDFRSGGCVAFVDCRMEGWTEGLYASAHAGPLVVRGGRYANSNVAQVRTGGPNALVDGVEVMLDNPETLPNESTTRGIWAREGEYTRIADCDVVVGDAFGDENSDSEAMPGISGGVVHGAKAGRLCVEATDISVDADGVNAVRSLAAKDGQFYAPSMVERGETVDAATLDRRLELVDVTIRGDAAGVGKFGRMAVDIRNRRHDSTVRNCEIRQSGRERDGVRVVAADRVSVVDSTVDVTGAQFDVDDRSAETFVQSAVSGGQ
ncbi:hypothetical protein AUR64_05625 [Haloprofundus marisrubri]|uniref:Right handed beta helix domain-containing protein n=1 Tax=Haloprofundus marisrubri TaxID=1514971 RepID=A0A0W1RBA6_9EURY|nr:hypothetical protein [Haloprofundus marisrubri]KTG10677.1 hypothetical protein AUR64_05625 [Haloprofundus marisrubri]